MTMKKKEKPTKWFWLDLEMTGLNPTRDRIFEVAVIITDSERTELATYSATVHHDTGSFKKLIKENPVWADRGFKEVIGRVKQGINETKIEKELITLVEKYYLPGEAVYLAGNSIRVDRSFIDSWMPNFAKFLHYRMLDVSTFKLWWVAQGGKEYKKRELHSALPDIRESIAELKYYSSKLNQ